jgi:hypothetical protein
VLLFTLLHFVFGKKARHFEEQNASSKFCILKYLAICEGQIPLIKPSKYTKKLLLLLWAYLHT